MVKNLSKNSDIQFKEMIFQYQNNLNHCISSLMLIIVLLFFGSLISNAQNISNGEKIELMNLYNQSQDFLSKGDYNNAIKLKVQIYDSTRNTNDLRIMGGMCAYEIAQIYSIIYNDLNNYIRWLQKADECDFRTASGCLGDAYLTGNDGVTQDFQKAKYYYEKSNEGRCLWIIATMYSPNGELGKNDEEWLNYTFRAVEKDDPDAQFMLGLCYLNGKIVHKDYNQGVSLIKKAAQQNHIKAIRFLEEQNTH